MTRPDTTPRGHGVVRTVYHNPAFPSLSAVDANLARLSAVAAAKAIDGPRQRGGFSPNMRVKGGR